MNAELIAVGTEILLGQILNSNVKYISEKMADLGIDVFYHTSVGDNKKRIIEIIRIACERADIIILTGGLGPTGDDLTKEALAQFLQLPLEILPQEQEKLRAILRKSLQTSRLFTRFNGIKK
jgi:nicotinamide-nucleotide amidase